MLLDVLLFFSLGTVLGVLAGLVPGLHPNTVLMIMLSFFLGLGGGFSYPVLALVVSVSVANSIVNFIPSIFLGAPDPDSCLSVLPGHRFLLGGNGYYALFLTVAGGIGAMFFIAISVPFLLWFIPVVYGSVHAYMHWLLMATLLMLLYHERGKHKKAFSVFVFFVSGISGFLLFSTVPSDQVLFPALGGLFGLSVIIMSALQTISLPRQKVKKAGETGWLRGSLSGWLSGLFVGILPGIGSSQAGVLASRLLRGKEKDFMIALGGINTSNIVITFIALYAIGKTRSGAAWVVSEIIGTVTLPEIFFIVLVAVLSCLVSSVITLRTGKAFLNVMGRINYRALNISILIALLALIFSFSGLEGLVVAVLCTFIGLSSTALGVKRMYLMGFLMVPTILYFSRLSPAALLLLGL